MRVTSKTKETLKKNKTSDRTRWAPIFKFLFVTDKSLSFPKIFTSFYRFFFVVCGSIFLNRSPNAPLADFSYFKRKPFVFRRTRPRVQSIVFPSSRVSSGKSRAAKFARVEPCRTEKRFTRVLGCNKNVV